MCRAPQAIAALRAKASGAYDDHGITTATGGAMIADGDANSIANSRTPNQVPVLRQQLEHQAASCVPPSMRRALQHGALYMSCPNGRVGLGTGQ